jgi:ArsR family transcriptional regulator
MNKQLIQVMKALADQTRLELVLNMLGKDQLSTHECSKSIALSQPTLSHHYKKLVDAGIIKVTKEGVNHFYTVDTEYLQKIGIDLNKLAKNSSNF